MYERANILKNAELKYKVLEEILNILESPIRNTLIYCSPEQIDKTMSIINSRGVVVHRFTQKEGTSADKKFNGLSEREYLLKKFAECKYQILVAMKCLDEGVDIPPAKMAILMASSSNPREYIQRIGRVIRRYPGKEEAIIYDIIVVPTMNSLPPELKKIEWGIFNKELLRVEEIADIAINNAEVFEEIQKIKEKVKGWKYE